MLLSAFLFHFVSIQSLEGERIGTSTSVYQSIRFAFFISSSRCLSIFFTDIKFRMFVSSGPFHSFRSFTRVPPYRASLRIGFLRCVCWCLDSFFANSFRLRISGKIRFVHSLATPQKSLYKRICFVCSSLSSIDPISSFQIVVDIWFSFLLLHFGCSDWFPIRIRSNGDPSFLRTPFWAFGFHNHHFVITFSADTLK